ncbi:acyl-CoA synthetase [Aquisalimonas asiatica]|uniref:Fatty-acyl-CoA synthase n=1 Tax=Aquisalimonas asiatica TaxID=406100 RepID=A0A1H8SJX9_9GAMM|nr:acyl-CoA synthetase [Aquisalimonas asiatica]SEO78826.1 fatty-acyl-CoA synthase [Aquisalimonas asiatica]
MSTADATVHTDQQPNEVPLTPLSMLDWAVLVYPNHPAVIHGDRTTSYAEYGARCRQLASALRARGIGPGQTVATVLPNIPPMLEAHFGVPMAGAVLNTINIRLDARTIGFILDHGEADALITDTEFAPVVREALAHCDRKPLVIDVDDPEGPGGERLGELDYEALVAEGDPQFRWQWPGSEWDSISLNYTSGTTGNPKGALYHHRGAHQGAYSNIIACEMGRHPVYLWTLPMFHCNGWRFPWTLPAVAGTSVCLRKVEPAAIFEAIGNHKVSHFCGAPLVLNMLTSAPEASTARFDHSVTAYVGGAAPPAAVIGALEGIGIHVIHLYGLTETYGPSHYCAWKPEWDALPLDEQASMASRQGVRYLSVEETIVADPDTMAPVPMDGTTMGEIMVRGNSVMTGYLKNPEATAEAFRGGWYHTGDLAVWHPDGYLEIRDRAKDVIISGGENISTIEVEDALYKHPAVLECAVVAAPSDRWGETPCAVITLRPDAGEVTPADIVAFCRKRLAGFKIPRHVLFEALPKTSTGKIQKFVLREKVAALTDGEMVR